MRPEKLLEKLTSGSYHNVAFGDLCRLAEAFGFHLSRARGSHHIYEHRATYRYVWISAEARA